ncbi:MAG: secretin N-terminal domain-containing protein [Candidatus Omnitrophota bacterium]
MLAAALLLSCRSGFAEQAAAAGNKATQLAQMSVPQNNMPSVVPILPVSGITGKITLDLRNIDVVDALKFLSGKAGLNIITTRAVAGRVSLIVNNAPICDVFDLMLRSNNLAYDKKGDIYNVMSQEEYRSLYGKNFSDVRKVKVFYLKYMVPEQAFSLLDMLKSEIGRIMVDAESGNIMAMDSPARLEVMEQALKDFEETNTVKVIKLNYAKAKDIEETLRNQLDSKKVGLIKADERDNQLLIQALPDRMEQIERLIKDLDRKTKEVIIDVDIVQVSLSNQMDTGVQWQGLMNVSAGDGLTYMGSVPFSAQSTSSDDTWISRKTAWNTSGIGSYSSNYSSSTTGAKTLGEELHIGVVGHNDFDVVLKYLQTVGKTRIMSNPKLVVTNNQEAKIHVGQKEAYVTTTTTTGSSTNTVSEQVTFVDVGVLLSVVPNINDDGFINLKVKAEVSSVIDVLVTPTDNQIPIIDTSLAETTVLVKQGSTVIIGGLRKEQKIESDEGIPYLSKIPFLGRFFSVKSNAHEVAELLIIMTPRIITGEVLVTSAGIDKNEKIGLKSTQDYDDLQVEKLREQLSNEVYVPLDEKKLKLKGLKRVK